MKSHDTISFESIRLRARADCRKIQLENTMRKLMFVEALSRRNFDRRASFGRFWDGQRASKKRPKGKSAERSGWPSGTLPFGAFGRRFFDAVPWTLFSAFSGFWTCGAVPSMLRHGSFRKGPQMSELNSRPKDVQKTTKTGKRDRLF